MLSKEILTLQLGHYSNFVGTHWWNIQEACFEYQASEPPEIDHSVLFREGLTSKGQVTFTPRLLLVDLKNSLRTLTVEGSLYEPAPEHSSSIVDEDVQVLQEPCEPKNDFQQHLEDPQATLTKTFNLDDKVQVWSDFLYTRFHPRSVNIVKEYQHRNEHTPFDTYTLGTLLWNCTDFEDEFTDKIRMYVEECDSLQGFHVVTDCTNGFSGLSSGCIQHLHDEYNRKSVLVFPVIPSHFMDNEFETPEQQVQSIMNDSTRVINLLMSFNQYSEFGSMFVPLCTGESGWRQPGTPKNFHHTQYNHKLPYHSSAILASALDTFTLKYRLKSSACSLTDICGDLTVSGRKAVAASLCLPFSLNNDSQLIECLDQWEGALYKSITPRCSIGSYRQMQHLVIRGIPEDRLKKNTEKHRSMAAYKCSSVKEMLELCLACSTHASVSNVCAVKKPLPVTGSYPNIFDDRIGVNGNVQAEPRGDGRVETVPVLAGLHSGTEIGAMLESLHIEAAKLKIARFHQFAMSRDEYEENLHELLSLKENYEDSYLI